MPSRHASKGRTSRRRAGETCRSPHDANSRIGNCLQRFRGIAACAGRNGALPAGIIVPHSVLPKAPPRSRGDITDQVPLDGECLAIGRSPAQPRVPEVWLPSLLLHFSTRALPEGGASDRLLY